MYSRGTSSIAYIGKAVNREIVKFYMTKLSADYILRCWILIYSLDYQTPIPFIMVPGHMHIPDNLKADESARMGLHYKFWTKLYIGTAIHIQTSDQARVR